jgi:hypothetical protein
MINHYWITFFNHYKSHLESPPGWSPPPGEAPKTTVTSEGFPTATSVRKRSKGWTDCHWFTYEKNGDFPSYVSLPEGIIRILRFCILDILWLYSYIHIHIYILWHSLTVFIYAYIFIYILFGIVYSYIYILWHCLTIFIYAYIFIYILFGIVYSYIYIFFGIVWLYLYIYIWWYVDDIYVAIYLLGSLYGSFFLALL